MVCGERTLLLAGGIGITPLLCMAHASGRHWCPNSRCTTALARRTMRPSIGRSRPRPMRIACTSHSTTAMRRRSLAHHGCSGTPRSACVSTSAVPQVSSTRSSSEPPPPRVGTRPTAHGEAACRTGNEQIMTVMGTLRDAAQRRTSYFLDGALLSYKSVLIGATRPDPTTPSAFLVEQSPNRELPPHFHGYGQFQVVVAGSGRLGSRELTPLCVHYAGQRTPYGPIRAGVAGLSYLTLRPKTEGSAFFMPQSRNLRDPTIQRDEIFSDVQSLRTVTERIFATEVQTVSVLQPTSNGLAAWLIRLPPLASAAAPILPNGSGRFHVVVGGALARTEGIAGWLTTLWTEPQESLVLRASDIGAEVLVLQFPGDACKHSLPAAAWSATPNDLDVLLQPLCAIY